METEQAKKEGDKDVKMEKRKKTVNKTIELPVSSRVQGQLSFDKLQAATTSETLMAKADRDEAERLNSKNSVEEYIYEIRGKICDELEDFMLEGDRERFSRELTDAEDWLYEDGEFADKKTYTEKLATLRSTGEAVRKRRREHMERPEAINQFGQCMQLAQKAVDSFKAGDEKFNHLDTAEVEKVQKAIAEKQDWFSRMCADVSKLDKTSDPPVLASQFYQEKESFWHMASNILNKQKPKVRNIVSRHCVILSESFSQLLKLDITNYSVLIVHRGNKSLKVKHRIFPNSKISFSTLILLVPFLTLPL
jgi:hypothetical protein